MRRYHTRVLLSGVCGTEWGVDLLSNAVTRELLGCRVARRNKKPFAVWMRYETWAVWGAKIKWKAVSARLGYAQETNLGHSGGELSVPRLSFIKVRSLFIALLWNLSSYQNHRQTKVAVSNWFWRRDAALLTVTKTLSSRKQRKGLF